MRIPLTASLMLFSMVALLFSGCSEKPESTSPTSSTSGTDVDSDQTGSGGHVHSSEGPHGGDLIELGNDEYHAELVHPRDHDDDAHSHQGNDNDGDATHDHAGVTVYILDGAARNLVPIAAADISLNLSHAGRPEQFKLTAMPTETDSDGRSSRFASADRDLLEHFHEEEIEGTLVLKINGTSYRGRITHSHAGGGGHSHSHGDDDALVWRGEPRDHVGLKIQAGHHGRTLHAGKSVEPAVSITRDGQVVSDARVFNSLLSADGRTVLAKEVGTVFEPATKDEPAHYAQGALSIPKDVETVVIRYRVAIPDVDEVTFDVPVTVE